MKVIWDVPGCAGIALHSGRVFNRYGPPHDHAEYEMGLLHGGSGRSFYRRAYHTTPPRTLIVFQSGEAHAGHLTATAGYLYRTFLYITPVALHALAADVGHPAVTPCFPQITLPTLADAFRRLWVALPTAASDLERQTTVHTFFKALLWHTPQHPLPAVPRQEHVIAQRIRGYLEERYAENITLGDLQQLTNMSRDYLLAVFRQAYGESPHRFLIHTRLERAKDALRRGLPIAYVALLTGFTDQAHLTHHFRKYLAYTPGWYVRAIGLQTDPENVQEFPHQLPE